MSLKYVFCVIGKIQDDFTNVNITKANSYRCRYSKPTTTYKLSFFFLFISKVRDMNFLVLMISSHMNNIKSLNKMIYLINTFHSSKTKFESFSKKKKG